MRALTLSVLAFVLFLAWLGGPVALYSNFHEHHGSVAYHMGGGKSYLLDGDRHGRVCDNQYDGYNEHARFHRDGAKTLRVYDKNGAKAGCGDRRFTKPRDAHKTCTFRGCGAWSLH